MFDSHSHLLPDFMKDVGRVVENAINSGVRYIVNSAIEPHQVAFTFNLEEKYKKFIYSTIGFAPQKIKKINFNESVRAIENNESIVAVGEIGLDYHWINEALWREKQKEAFIQLIKLANSMEKPIVIHSRKAESDCIDILEKHSDVPVLMHCFAGNAIETERVIELGWLISIPTAVVNRKKHRKITRKTPLKQIVVETDSPFLSPIPRTQNEPANICYAIEEVAKLKKTSFEEVNSYTTKNALEFFNIT